MIIVGIGFEKLFVTGSSIVPATSNSIATMRKK
jgi:hypothetical protein